MNHINYTFSDTLAGYASGGVSEDGYFMMKTSDGREYNVRLKGNTYSMLVRNLGEPYHDCTGQMRSMIEEGRHLFVYGVYYPERMSYTFEAQFIIFDGRRPPH